MRFIGNKEIITTDIKLLLREKGLLKERLTFFDAFCGTGAVADALKEHYNIVANDILRWCVMYTRGRICANSLSFSKLGFDPIEYFNSNKNVKRGFFYNNYSPTSSKRMYFSADNAARIDYFRSTIERWREQNKVTQDEYAYLLTCLIESVSTVANTAGVYGAFLKHWDPRALKPIQFKHIVFNGAINHEYGFLNAKIEDIVSEIQCDIIYLDPPYTQNQYGTQYHLLETLVLNDSPRISDVTGSRPTTPMRSDWSKNYKAHILFDLVIARTKAKHILFSYSSDGFLSRTFIEACLKRYGKADTYTYKKISYKKYTNTKSRRADDHFEYLFYIEKKEERDIIYESPLNYIGSKAKIASSIICNVPSNISSFVDAFGGGFNVGINIQSQKIVYNDINHFVCSLVHSFRAIDTYEYILYLKRVIKKFGLEPTVAKSYLHARKYYNSLPHDKRDPRLLYAIILYGYNQQIRFNGSHDFNNPVGMRWFNDKVLEKMISFSRVIKEKSIVFESKDYNELYYETNNSTFTYFDPPYMLTNGSYNDGKRGFHGWTVETEKKLFNYADQLNREGKHFMVSYIMEHKGQKNISLINWIKMGGYRIIRINPIKGKYRKEILIVNYT